VLNDANLASDQAIIAALSASSGGTIIRVDYRVGDSAHYPLAVHDVLAGYDWVKERLHEHDGGENIHTIGVCGQLVGGSLAAMLALTECRIGQTRVAAAALNAPVLDWVFPSVSHETPSRVDDFDENRIPEAKKSRGRRKKKIESSWEEFRTSKTLPASSLLKARNALFKTADSYFDPFASPIHFFRGPGIEVPLSHEPDSPVSTPVPIRKSRRAYPPTASNLTLPATRLSIGDSNVLLSQGKEYTDTLQMRWIKGSLNVKRGRLRNADTAMVSNEDEVSMTDTAISQAKRRFALKLLPNAGIWGHGEEHLWREDVESAGRWLREVLV
jgi:acetyl esterase/lipase